MSWRDSLTAAGVDTGTGIAQVGGDPAFYREALALFLAENARRIPAMKAAAPEDLVRPAHGLKSDCRTLGAAACGDLAARLERAARDGDDAAVQTVLPELLAKTEQLDAAIRAALEQT